MYISLYARVNRYEYGLDTIKKTLKVRNVAYL